MRERLRYQLSVSVFVILKRQDKLCMFRRCGTGWMDGSWSIPAGGLEAGETIRAAAMREAHEEVGVNILSEDLHHVHSLHSRTDGRTWLGHFFQATNWDGIPRLCEPDKHSDLQWQFINGLPSGTLPYVRQAITSVAAHQTYSEYGWD